MPTPAGTGLSRRGFLLASAGVALSVYGAGRLLDPPRSRRGSPRPRQSAGRPVLVSVYLQGGIDAMSVLYPAGDPLYTKYRTMLALPKAPAPSSQRIRACTGIRWRRRWPSFTARASSA